MKRFTVALLASLLLTTPAAQAQTRVEFPSGRNTVVLKSETTGGPSELGGMNPRTYIVRGREGQQITLRLTSAKKNAVFAVYLPNLESLIEDATNETNWSGTLPRTGDYEIIVFPQDEMTDTPFALEITIQ